jgi:hypothetical protein
MYFSQNFIEIVATVCLVCLHEEMQTSSYCQSRNMNRSTGFPFVIVHAMNYFYMGEISILPVYLYKIIGIVN